MQQLRYAFRMLVKSPGFSLIAFAASFFPGRAALRLNPVEVLRHD